MMVGKVYICNPIYQRVWNDDEWWLELKDKEGRKDWTAVSPEVYDRCHVNRFCDTRPVH